MTIATVHSNPSEDYKSRENIYDRVGLSIGFLYGYGVGMGFPQTNFLEKLPQLPYHILSRVPLTLFQKISAGILCGKPTPAQPRLPYHILFQISFLFPL